MHGVVVRSFERSCWIVALDTIAGLSAEAAEPVRPFSYQRRAVRKSKTPPARRCCCHRPSPPEIVPSADTCTAPDGIVIGCSFASSTRLALPRLKHPVETA